MYNSMTMKNGEINNKIKVKSRKQLQSIILERYSNNNSFVNLTDIDISELDDLTSIFFWIRQHGSCRYFWMECI